MNFKLFKLGAAAALTVSGASVISNLKPVAATTYKSAIKRVKISYLPGNGVRIWTNYQNGRFMGFRAKDGTEWNVVKTAVDKSGNLWYMVGDNEWIQARYTVDIASTASDLKAEKKSKSLLTKAKEAVTIKLPDKADKTDKKEETKTSKTAKTSTKKTAEVATVATSTSNKESKESKNVSQSVDSVQGIINLAKEQVGKSYAWGANGPDTFDCSSLVQYVYQKAAGINLPRTTYDQVKVGQTVSIDELQPGDLIFWGSTNAPYHVALYIGNNQYVNAATPEQGVVLQTLSSYYYPTIAKRIL